jgi:hypothetical protein
MPPPANTTNGNVSVHSASFQPMAEMNISNTPAITPQIVATVIIANW